jgi:lipopolysaccharide export system permease protein
MIKATAKKDFPLNVPLILWRDLVKKVVVWTIGGTLFLSLIVSFGELFSLLWKFLARDASFWSVLTWVGLGASKHITEALPVAFLFAVVFILSDLHANRELESIFSAGISLQRFLLPLILFSLVLCATEFVMTEYAAIPSLRQRNALQAAILKESNQKTSIPGLITEQGRFVYTFRYWDSKNLKLYDISVLERDSHSDIKRKISAPQATWDNGVWRFENAETYEKEGNSWKYSHRPVLKDSLLNEPPKSFERPTMDVRMLNSAELNEHIAFLAHSGLPTADAEVERQRRFSFSLTPLIVIGLAGAFVGRFKKSIFLLSLLFSLSSATLYYVAQMLASLAAKSGAIQPGLAMWSVMGGFTLLSGVSFFSART